MIIIMQDACLGDKISQPRTRARGRGSSFIYIFYAAAALMAEFSGWWSHVEIGPPDAIFGLVEAFKNDPRSKKVNLGIGVYTDDKGDPYVFPVVRKVEKEVQQRELDKEYAGILGYSVFTQAAIELVLGKDDKHVQDHLYASAQTVAGTGALRVMGGFLKKFYPYSKTIYLSDHTWPNHPQIFRDAGLDIKYYHYYDPKTCGFNAEAAYADLKSIPEHSIVLFQACGHNPTGVDPNMEEWTEISRICKERQHFIVMDVVYQGFASGDLEEDVAGVRKLVQDGHKLGICQSFSKNMGLYGERVGAATILCSNEEEKKAVESQMKIIIRPMYSNPPINGARIATEILNNPTHRAEWQQQLKEMAAHVIDKRKRLQEALVATGSVLSWTHIVQQKGWFCFTGMTKPQVERLTKEYGILMTTDGRVPVVVLSAEDVPYVANAINTVTRSV